MVHGSQEDGETIYEANQEFFFGKNFTCYQKLVVSFRRNSASETERIIPIFILN